MTTLEKIQQEAREEFRKTIPSDYYVELVADVYDSFLARAYESGQEIRFERIESDGPEEERKLEGTYASAPWSVPGRDSFMFVGNQAFLNLGGPEYQVEDEYGNKATCLCGIKCGIHKP